MKNEGIEYQSLERQNEWQLQKIKELVLYLQHHSPFYKEKFKNENFIPSEIRSLNDLQNLSTTNKEDIQTNNWKFLCVPHSEIRDISCTSGTLGGPIQIALTERDLERLGYNEKLTFEKMGISNKDRVQLMLTLDKQFMAGMAYYQGLQQIGATAIRAGVGLPKMQWNLMEKLKTTALVCVPSFFLKMLLEKPDHIDIHNLDVKKILAIGENLNDESLGKNPLYQKIKEHCELEIYNTYASTEMQTAFTECEMGQGGHQNPELIFIELLNDEGQPVGKGKAGELVITTLGVEGMPLLRYETGDICKIYEEPCSCGRTTRRVGPVLARKKQMIKYKGTSVYPSAIIDVILQQKEINDYVIEVLKDEYQQDRIIVYLKNHMLEKEILQKIKPDFQHKIRVVPEIKFISEESMKIMQFPNHDRKPRKIIDKRF